MNVNAKENWSVVLPGEGAGIWLIACIHSLIHPLLPGSWAEPCTSHSPGLTWTLQQPPRGLLGGGHLINLWGMQVRDLFTAKWHFSKEPDVCVCVCVCVCVSVRACMQRLLENEAKKSFSSSGFLQGQKAGVPWVSYP